MLSFLVTLVALALLLLTVRALLRHSRFAIGIAVGGVLALMAWSAVEAVAGMEHVPLWLPPLPFALVAVTLFVFGLLAWFWSEG
jgi:hypothetical protein